MKHIYKYSGFLIESTKIEEFKDYTEVQSAFQELIDEGCSVMIHKLYTMNTQTDPTQKFQQGRMRRDPAAGFYPSYQVTVTYPKDKHDYDFDFKIEFYTMLKSIRTRLDDFNVNVSGRYPEIVFYILDRGWKDIEFSKDDVANTMFLENPRIHITMGAIKSVGRGAIITYPKSGIGKNKYHIQILPDIKNQLKVKYPHLKYELDENIENNVVFSTTIIPLGYKE